MIPATGATSRIKYPSNQYQIIFAATYLPQHSMAEIEQTAEN
ncbi:hypothetical protein ACZ87_03979, partial [Candidatus Erwinia dacicola]